MNRLSEIVCYCVCAQKNVIGILKSFVDSNLDKYISRKLLLILLGLAHYAVELFEVGISSNIPTKKYQALDLVPAILLYN